MQTKPIITILLPNSTDYNDFKETLDYLEENKELNEQYFVLIAQSNIDKIEFQCFYDKDFNDIKYEELKKIIIDNIKK